MKLQLEREGDISLHLFQPSFFASCSVASLLNRGIYYLLSHGALVGVSR